MHLNAEVATIRAPAAPGPSASAGQERNVLGSTPWEPPVPVRCGIGLRPARGSGDELRAGVVLTTGCATLLGPWVSDALRTSQRNARRAQGRDYGRCTIATGRSVWTQTKPLHALQVARLRRRAHRYLHILHTVHASLIASCNRTIRHPTFIARDIALERPTASLPASRPPSPSLFSLPPPSFLVIIRGSRDDTWRNPSIPTSTTIHPAPPDC